MRSKIVWKNNSMRRENQEKKINANRTEVHVRRLLIIKTNAEYLIFFYFRASVSEAGDEKREGPLKKYHVEKSFADRRYKVSSARTYFYLNEASCERNMDIFIKCLEAVASESQILFLALSLFLFNILFFFNPWLTFYPLFLALIWTI